MNNVKRPAAALAAAGLLALSGSTAAYANGDCPRDGSAGTYPGETTGTYPGETTTSTAAAGTSTATAAAATGRRAKKRQGRGRGGRRGTQAATATTARS